MNKFITKVTVGLVIVAAVVMYSPTPTALASPESIFIYGFGYQSWQGRISPWPWPQPYYTPGLYEGATIYFQQIPVLGDFPGTDQISIDCRGTGTYDVITYSGTTLQNVWRQNYWMSTSNASCSYPTYGQYSPVIRVVRSGSGPGCGYSGNWYWTCWGDDYRGVTATTDYSVGAFDIYPITYDINVWPNSRSPYVDKAPQNVNFVVQANFRPVYLPYSSPVGGSFNYHIDCGDGSPIKDVSGYGAGSTYVNNITYDSNYNPIGSAGQWVLNAAGISGCNYTNPGVYRVVIGADGGGATRTQYGASEVTLFPSSKLSVQVSASPATGDAPLNNVKIHADAAGIMPAIGQFGSVSLVLRCDGNLLYEQLIAQGISRPLDPSTGQPISDGQISDVYNINFNTSGTPMVPTLSRDFSCSYPIAGTHTPTVVVQQKGMTGAGGSKVYVVGQLKCDGTDILKAPTNYRLDWDTVNTSYCSASTKMFKSYSGFDYSRATNFTGQQPSTGSQTFYRVPAGNYEYDLSCVGKDPTQNVQSSCAVQVIP